jgi:hypothetical protein
VLVGTKAEVLNGFTRVLRTAKEKRVLSSGRTKSELVESDGLSTSGNNAGASRGSEPERGNGALGDLKEAIVIGDGANNNDYFALAIILGVGNNAGERDGRAVGAREKETAKDNLVERGIRTACS